ncbi:MFS transporter [Paenibacillus polymyxa]|uniref:MFS transporter n=1 Tax=Paenibacillus polymyxa TaxID=1406 RepID=UPI00234932ED|nr:MFS transporter [Paenibacillus polymyxa]WCM63690.1 MFS transporter [Paenibacillus polymyxa]
MRNNLLSNPRFLFFYLSRTSANIADSIYMIVMLYFVQSITESVSYTSFTYSAITATSMFSFIVGPIVDRHSPLKLASLSLLMQAIIIFFVPFLIGEQSYKLILILVLVFLASCFSLLFYPANSKLIPILMRNNDDIIKANVVINSTDQVINIVGYLLGASIIIFLGMKNTFYLASGLLLLAGLTFFWMSRNLIPSNYMENEPAKHSGSFLLELKEGFSFVKQNVFLKIMMPFYALINFLLAMLIITIPSLAVSAGSPIYYSLIYIVFFIGMFCGSILTNYVPKKAFVIAVAWILMGISLCVFSLMQGIWLKMVAVLPMGIGSGLINVQQTAIIHIITPTKLLGRVLSFLSSISNASLPLGALVGGVLTLRFPLENVLLFSAVLIMASGLILLCIKTVRQFTIEDQTEERQKEANVGGNF